MAIRISLSLDGLGLCAETDHGHQFNLPRDPLECHKTLMKLLATQSKPKVVKKGYDQNWSFILAEWERIGPDGAGKIHKGIRPPRQQKFDEKGNRTEHNDPIELLP